MEKTVSGVFDSPEDVTEAVKMMRAEGIPPEDIVMVAMDQQTPEAGRKGGAAGSAIAAGAAAEFPPAESASSGTTLGGAVLGGLIGGVVALMVGLGAVVLPGMEGLMVAGPAVATLGGIAVGAAAGGLIGSLFDAYAGRRSASDYPECSNDRDVMVTVRVDHHQAPRIATILSYFNAHEVKA